MIAVEQVASRQPEIPLVWHGQRAERDLDCVARLHEDVRIPIGLVGVRVMEVMRPAKIRERDQRRNQRDAAPREVRSPRAAEVTVDALVGHDRAQENQVRPDQDVQGVQGGVGRNPEQGPEGSRDDQADDRAADEVRPPSPALALLVLSLLAHRDPLSLEGRSPICGVRFENRGPRFPGSALEVPRLSLRGEDPISCLGSQSQRASLGTNLPVRPMYSR